MIQCQDSAVKYLIDSVLKGKGRVIKEVNKSRHKIVELETKERWYCVYKREFYHTFSKEFEDELLKHPYYVDSEGESLNQEALKEAQRNDCDKLVFIHPDAVYFQYLNAFLSFAISNNLIREQERENEYLFEGGKRKAVHEITYSVPVPFLEKM
jgi:hypothetical protein